MAFVVVMVCIALQRFLKWGSYKHQIDWADPYFHWMVAKVEHIMKGHALTGLAILVLPVLLVVGIIFSLGFHLLGQVGYWVLAAVLLWYCLDARDIRQEPYADAEVNRVWELRYQHLFAVIFWFVAFGPVGLALYSSVSALRHFFAGQPAETHAELLGMSQRVLTLLDWVPLRLFGFSCALAGHFRVVFKAWLPSLKQLDWAGEQALAAEWGKLALGDIDTSDADRALRELAHVLDILLIAWLVVMALLSI